MLLKSLITWEEIITIIGLFEQPNHYHLCIKDNWTKYTNCSFFEKEAIAQKICNSFLRFLKEYNYDKMLHLVVQKVDYLLCI